MRCSPINAYPLFGVRTCWWQLQCRTNSCLKRFRVFNGQVEAALRGAPPKTKSEPPAGTARPPRSLAASARLGTKGLMAVAAVPADGLETGLQSIDVLGT